MDLSTEQELLAGARGNDQEKLGTIYDQYSPGLYRYAYRLLGGDDLAEDCVAETFSRFLHALHAGGGPREHLKAYLYRIAHNWITDRYSRCVVEEVELDESTFEIENIRPEKQVENRQVILRVRLALRSLTPEQRQVITLSFLEGWENAEIAAAVEKPVGAVKALRHRAIASLKRILAREEIIEND
jgi:RNA polymerase sigma-70 factor, ECF subfamily